MDGDPFAKAMDRIRLIGRLFFHLRTPGSNLETFERKFLYRFCPNLVFFYTCFGAKPGAFGANPGASMLKLDMKFSTKTLFAHPQPSSGSSRIKPPKCPNLRHFSSAQGLLAVSSPDFYEPAKGLLA